MQHAVKMHQDDLSFEQLMQLYNHIGEEERHFNTLEVEYRKLASQWLLVALGAVGFILTKKEILPIDPWALVIGVCLAASTGILVLWLVDLKVYHELLHSAFKEGVLLEDKFSSILPRIRNNMRHSQAGGDIITKVILFYFFSVVVLIIIANISFWMLMPGNKGWCVGIDIFSVIVLGLLYWIMTKNSGRNFLKKPGNQ